MTGLFQVSSFLYPFSIEYNILVVAIWYILWSNIGKVKCHMEIITLDSKLIYHLLSLTYLYMIIIIFPLDSVQLVQRAGAISKYPGVQCGVMAKMSDHGLEG